MRLEIGSIETNVELSCSLIDMLNNATATAVGVDPSIILLVVEPGTQEAENATRRRIRRRSLQTGGSGFAPMYQLIFASTLTAASDLASQVSAAKDSIEQGLASVIGSAGAEAPSIAFLVTDPTSIGTLEQVVLPSSTPSTSAVSMLVLVVRIVDLVPRHDVRNMFISSPR